MAAILMNLNDGDEIIMPSYTFVSTTSPFILRGASIAFADSLPNHPNIDLDHAEELINDRTKVLMVMHYGGVAVDMDKAVYLAEKYDLILLEDTAHSIDSYYKGKPLGSFGHFSTCSFHETKNISSGEGGMLVVNDENFIPRAEIIWEKGTNRSAFSRGEISKYEWVDVGSSYNPSDMIAAFLYAQLNHLEDIQQTRINIWHRYESNLKALANDGSIELPLINDYATNNGHVFYLITSSKSERNNLLKYLNSKKIIERYKYFHSYLYNY